MTPLAAKTIGRGVPSLSLARSAGADRGSRRERVAIGVAAVVFALTRLCGVPRFGLTFDEIYTLEVSQRGFWSLLAFLTAYDEHPPLFYLLVKAWTLAGGVGYWWLGLLPAVTAAATLVPLLLLCRALAMTKCDTAYVVALMAVNGYLIGFAEELRPYSLLLLLTLCSLWLFVETWNAQRRVYTWLAALTITNVLLVGTHHFGWLVIGAEGLILTYWKHPLTVRFWQLVAGTVALLGPWAMLLASSARARLVSGQRAFFYIPRPTLKSVAFFYGTLSGALDRPHTLAPSLLLVAIPLAVCLWSMRGRDTRDGLSPAITALAVFATLPVAVAFVVSKLSVGTAVWGQRHLIVAAAPFFVLVAVGIGQVGPPVPRRVLGGAVLIWSIVSGWQCFVTPYKVVAWDALAEQMARAEADQTGPVNVFTANENAALPLQFYLRRRGARQFRVVVVQPDTPKNRRIFSGAGPRPYWAFNLPVVLRPSTSLPRCDHCWIALIDGDEPTIHTESGLRLDHVFSDVLVSRRWNSAVVSVERASDP